MRGLAAGILLALSPLILPAQSTATLNLYPPNPAVETDDLNQAITEANGSSIDLTRALERHLRKYPNSPRKADIVASLYKTAADGNDSARIALYGEMLLTGHPANELEVLDRVIRALLIADDAESAKKALAWVKRYEAGVDAMRARPAEGHTTAAQWTDLADRALARATVLEARALGNLGNLQEAVIAARRSWNAQPTAEAAHETAHWLAKLSMDQAALEYYADAATVEDPRAPWAERERDRKLAASMYMKIHGTEQGLGDVFLHAWESSADAMNARVTRYKAIDRNYNLSDLFEFVLPAGGVAAAAGPTIATAGAPALEMNKLRGKTLVMDFWATWCLPCIAQHPLIEQVKQRYAGSTDVVFLSLNADDDHSLVAPFIKAQNWNQRVYLEAGLAGLLNVTSLPTVLVVDPTGKLYSRMTGFNPDVFARMLGSRIDDARAVVGK